MFFLALNRRLQPLQRLEVRCEAAKDPVPNRNRVGRIITLAVGAWGGRVGSDKGGALWVVARPAYAGRWRLGPNGG